MKVSFVLNCWTLSSYGLLRKLVFMFQNASKIWIRDMCENGKPWIASKMEWVFIKNELSTAHSFNFRKEVNSVISSFRCA